MRAYRIVWTIAVAVFLARGVMLGLDRHPAIAGTALLLGAGAGAAWAARGPAQRTAATVMAAAVPAAVVGHLPSLGAGLIVIGFVVLASSPGFIAASERWIESPEESSAFDAIVRALAHAAPVYVPPPDEPAHEHTASRPAARSAHERVDLGRLDR